MPVNIQQYCHEIGTFYNCSSKYTFLRYNYKLNYILMSFFLYIFSCLAFYVATFIKTINNCTGFILKVSIISSHLLISYSLLIQLLIYSHRAELNPWSKRDINQCFSVYHWSLNSFA